MRKKLQNSRSKKVAVRKTRSVANSNKRTIIWISILFVAVFFVVAALKSQQTLQQQAAGTPGSVCLQMQGTCNVAGSCAVFENDAGPQDCGTGQTCCVN